MLSATKNSTKKKSKISAKNICLGVFIGFGFNASLGSAALAHTTKTTHHAASSTHIASSSHSNHSTKLASTSHHAVHVATSHHTTTHLVSVAHNSHERALRLVTYSHARRVTPHYRYSGLQCVPYAREVSHIELSGDAFLWWAEASGRYARGNAPAEGAVLNFRAIRRMPLGHVAVVTGIIDSRTILVTQANWVRGTITNDVTVQDVSPDNDWSQVQVELGDTSTLGAAYPTYGFIYNQPATSTVIASNGSAAASTEVAEAPRAVTIPVSGPNHSLQ